MENTCGYCHEAPCICDGFGHDPLTGRQLDFSAGELEETSEDEELAEEVTSDEPEASVSPAERRAAREQYAASRPARGWRPQRRQP